MHRKLCLLYTLISTLYVVTPGQKLFDQVQISFESFSSDHSQDRPSWSTLPVSNPTKSFWIYDANPLTREGSTGPLGFNDDDIDVCIIGSGITGVSSAYHLGRFFNVQDPTSKRKIVILEAREFCSGATGRNGGHLTPNIFNGFLVREQLYGKENAKKSYALEDYVMSSIVDIIHSHGWTDEVDLVHGGHITVFNEDEEERKALMDYEDAQQGGLNLDGIELLDRQTMLQTYGINSPGVYANSYNLWPLKFVSNLYNLTSSINQNIQIKLHTFTPVTSVTSSPKSTVATGQDKKWIVVTPRGSLSCKIIIHATNAYASYLLPQLQDRIIPTRGQMFAVRAKTSLDRLKKHAWQANWGFEYWFPRPEETGEDEEYRPPLVMFGGGRDTAGPKLDQFTVDDSVLNGQVRKTLKDFLPGLYNETGLFEEGKDAEMEWTGIMGFTENSVPLVGSLAHLAGQYIAAGFTGHGMPRAFAVAEVVAGMISAKLTDSEWKTPEWLPEHYIMGWER